MSIWDDAKAAVASLAHSGVDDLAFLPAPVRDVLTGPVRDFAKSDVGMVVFRAMSTAGYFGLVPLLGPQLAGIAFAWPGLLRGDDFDKAWVTEFSWRLSKTAEVGGAELQLELSNQFQRVVDGLRGKIAGGDSEILNWTVGEVAKYFDVREDAAAEALALIKRAPEVLEAFDFDPATGRATPRDRTARLLSTLSTERREGPLFLRRLAMIQEMPTEMTHRLALASPAAASFEGGAPRSDASRRRDNVMLAAVVLAALGALGWWYFGEKKRRL